MQPPIKKTTQYFEMHTLLRDDNFYLQGIMFYSLLFKFNQNGLVLEP